MSSDIPSSTTKNVTATPVVTAFFKPSADFLGGKLRDFIESKLANGMEAQRISNIAGHLEAVGNRLKSGADAEPLIKKIASLKSLDAWIDGAKNVDPSASPLASMWQDLLVKIALDSSDTNLLLKKLKSLSPAEAETLIKFSSGFESVVMSKQHNYHLHDLQDKELVSVRLGRYLGIALSGMLLAFLAVSACTSHLGISRPFLSVGVMLGGGFASVGALVWLAHASKLWAPMWGLTWIGRELIAKAPTPK